MGSSQEQIDLLSLPRGSLTEKQIIQLFIEDTIETSRWFDGTPHLTPDQQKLIEHGKWILE